MTNIIIRGKTRNAWRKNVDAKYVNTSRDDVVDRGREVYEKTGSVRDAQNAMRELTMKDTKASRCFENFQAGVEAVAQLDTAKLDSANLEYHDRIIDIPVED